MVPMILTINSGLLVLATIFLIFAIGHTILTFSWTMLAYAAVIFLLLLLSEIAISFYMS
ncbi:hypothetical protein HZC00_02715 [Candidatus Kaiserbacteria bacterium]|nr:hypothetical protein [Candidatus Kaiserbacteria bacterium]